MHVFGFLGSVMFFLGFVAVVVVGAIKLVAIGKGVPAPLVTSSPYFYIALTMKTNDPGIGSHPTKGATIIPFVSVYVLPYMESTYAIYYMHLRELDGGFSRGPDRESWY